MATTSEALKRVLVGAPRATRELRHQLLPKWMALPVFSSDALSSVAYATQEMMIVLAVAGTIAFTNVMPLAFAVAVLLIIVVGSYRQTVRAYPHGGGAYTVARANLGERPGLLAAGALLVDYVLTVAVSVAAGVAAITSAAPGLLDDRVLLALAFVAFVTVANLRGVRESGMFFAVPTYLFIASIGTLIVLGLAACVGGCPEAPATVGLEPREAGALTVFLLLRAFASGATALTGVEAVSNGVPAFRYPQSRNAATTLGIMGVVSVSLFLGISWLAVQTGAEAGEGMTRTVIAQIALAVYGEAGLGFYVTQVATAAILILAANTAYADFPRLASVLAADRFLPRQFAARGDRLVFSNGIIALAVAASLLLIVFSADVTALIQLYVVGVFTAFTLSQSGMVRHWLRERVERWRWFLAVNALGAVATGLVLLIVAVTKFVSGAWMVIAGIPALAWLMSRIRAHYAAVSLELRAGVAEPEPPRPNHVVLLVDRVDEAAARAVSYARAVAPSSLRALALEAPNTDLPGRWAQLAPDVPLEILGAARSRGAAGRLREAVHAAKLTHEGEFTTALIAETLSRNWLDQLLHHRLALRVKTALLDEGDLIVADVTSPEGGPGPYTVEDPVEHHVVVLVAAVHKATIRALAYAETLRATTVRALSISLQPEHASRMLEAWEDWGVQVPLDIVDSPFRSISEAVREYVRELHPDGRQVIVTAVLPEFVLPRWWQQPLHNQTALLVKGALLFERGVVTVSVPFPLRLDQRKD
jgi:amino acid transporter